MPSPGPSSPGNPSRFPVLQGWWAAAHQPWQIISLVCRSSSGHCFGSRAEFPNRFLAKNPARSTRYRTVRLVRFAPKSWADSGLPSRPGNWDTCARHARRRMTGDTTHLSVSSCARRCTQPASSAVVVSTVGGCALFRVFMGLGSQAWWLHWAGQSCTLALVHARCCPAHWSPFCFEASSQQLFVLPVG